MVYCKNKDATGFAYDSPVTLAEINSRTLRDPPRFFYLSGVFLFFSESRRFFVASTRYGGGIRAHRNKGAPGIYLCREDRWGTSSAPPPRAAPGSAPLSSAPLRVPVFAENWQLFAGYFLEAPVLYFCWIVSVASEEKPRTGGTEDVTWAPLQPCSNWRIFTMTTRDDQTTSDVTSE